MKRFITFANAPPICLMFRNLPLKNSMVLVFNLLHTFEWLWRARGFFLSLTSFSPAFDLSDHNFVDQLIYKCDVDYNWSASDDSSCVLVRWFANKTQFINIESKHLFVWTLWLSCQLKLKIIDLLILLQRERIGIDSSVQ